jgi:hypothetical protein
MSSKLDNDISTDSRTAFIEAMVFSYDSHSTLIDALTTVSMLVPNLFPNANCRMWVS